MDLKKAESKQVVTKMVTFYRNESKILKHTIIDFKTHVPVRIIYNIVAKYRNLIQRIICQKVAVQKRFLINKMGVRQRRFDDPFGFS